MVQSENAQLALKSQQQLDGRAVRIYLERRPASVKFVPPYSQAARSVLLADLKFHSTILSFLLRGNLLVGDEHP